MADDVITLDHEYGSTAKLNVNPMEMDGADENQKPLKPLPPKYKYLATLKSVEEVISDPEIDGNINIDGSIATARINFIKLLKKSKKSDAKETEKIASNIEMKINSLIQPNIKKLLQSDNLDASDYYRSDTYFESTWQDHFLIIYWKKVIDNESI